MAFLEQDDVLDKLKNGREEWGPGAAPSDAPSSNQGAGFAGGAPQGGVPQQSTGSPGTGNSPFTNIQSYLNANPASGSRKILSEQFENPLNGRKAAYQQSSDAYQKFGDDVQAQNQYDPTKVWSAIQTGGDDYNKLNSSMSYQFGDGVSYVDPISGNRQSYANWDFGANAKDPEQFKTAQKQIQGPQEGMFSDYYDTYAGRGLSGGLRNLQNQIDSSDQGLSTGVQNTKQGFQDFQKWIDPTNEQGIIATTNKEVGANKDAIAKNQADLMFKSADAGRFYGQTADNQLKSYNNALITDKYGGTPKAPGYKNSYNQTVDYFNRAADLTKQGRRNKV